MATFTIISVHVHTIYLHVQVRVHAHLISKGPINYESPRKHARRLIFYPRNENGFSLTEIRIISIWLRTICSTFCFYLTK